MQLHLGEAKLSDFGPWDRIKIFFTPGEIEDTNHGWAWCYYKVYRGRKIIIKEGRYQ